ncbi:MAG: prepilin-type N-terminal cleavage/methylation domain-containing protein [Patescibacteria group bacterium]
MKNKKAFTLIELLVVIAIIGLLATLSVLALNNARAKGRDARRVSDIKQIQTALELYFNDKQLYPATLVTGSTITSTSSAGTSTYMQVIPSSPTPNVSTSVTGCGGTDYTYEMQEVGASYTLKYCLEGNVGAIPGQTLHTATNATLYTAE